MAAASLQDSDQPDMQAARPRFTQTNIYTTCDQLYAGLARKDIHALASVEGVEDSYTPSRTVNVITDIFSTARV